MCTLTALGRTPDVVMNVCRSFQAFSLFPIHNSLAILKFHHPSSLDYSAWPGLQASLCFKRLLFHNLYTTPLVVSLENDISTTDKSTSQETISSISGEPTPAKTTSTASVTTSVPASSAYSRLYWPPAMLPHPPPGLPPPSLFPWLPIPSVLHYMNSSVAAAGANGKDFILNFF